VGTSFCRLVLFSRKCHLPHFHKQWLKRSDTNALSTQFSSNGMVLCCFRVSTPLCMCQNPLGVVLATDIVCSKCIMLVSTEYWKHSCHYNYHGFVPLLSSAMAPHHDRLMRYHLVKSRILVNLAHSLLASGPIAYVCMHAMCKVSSTA
jgi:hypothetical protein